MNQSLLISYYPQFGELLNNILVDGDEVEREHEE
jgi:hypothetical protein